VLTSQYQYNIAIIGGGILGTCIAYFLSRATAPRTDNVVLIEQEKDISMHASSRNTGKVHAPFLYDPVEKKLFAKAAFLGFNMLKEYCSLKSLPFKQDGVLEVATHDRGIDRLHKYIDWGYSNGLKKEELQFLERDEVKKLEPNVRCLAGIYCTKDGSIDYGQVTRQILEDARRFGCTVVVGSKIIKILAKNSYRGDRSGNAVVLQTSNGTKIMTNYVVNTAGGNAVDIAHSMKVATDYTDLHFRGEYWLAPEEYRDLTKSSIYSVPKYPQYPFLDPHWIIRVDGRREIGPNAVPVFSPYAYNWSTNFRFLIPKIFESSNTGARRILFDKQFLHLASSELKSSISKTAMINRAKEFLPEIRSNLFTKRGTAGIRSSLIDKQGKFVNDTQIIKNECSLHVLNYNSPGATGALPIAAMIAHELIEQEIVSHSSSKDRSNESSINDKRLNWDTGAIFEEITR
jgi:L-2-hydroxyglutarate oxidase